MSQRIAPGLWLFALVLASVFAPASLAQQQPESPDVNIESFQDWEVRCPENGSTRGCEMTQLVNNPDNGQPILRVVMGYPPEIDTAAMILILPLGTRLTPGVQFAVDDGEPLTVPFQICSEQGCRADFPVEDTLRRDMRAGSNATVSLISPRGERIDLAVSLQGFTAADDRIAP